MIPIQLEQTDFVNLTLTQMEGFRSETETLKKRSVIVQSN